MKTKSCGVMLAIAGIMLLSFSTLARAAFIPVVDFTGGGLTTAPGNFSLGFQFTVGSLPFEVTAVGLRAGTPPSGQTVRIYENGTTTNTLVQAVFASDPLSGNGIYKYVDLATPILLQANTTYNFVVDHLPGDSILVFAGASSNNPDLTYVQSIGDSNSAGLFPTADNVNLGAYAGGTFQGHTVVAVCGNGQVEGAEQCDLGSALNGLPSSCCTAQCAFVPVNTTCRDSVGSCDVAEVCSGSSASCPANTFADVGTSCGGSDAACDALDTCDGGGNCIDNVDPVGTLCASANGICDPVDTCDGADKTCPVTVASAGTPCGGSEAECDALDTCNGNGGCVDRVKPAGTVCRPGSGSCDLAESCTGSSPSCPVDVGLVVTSGCTVNGIPNQPCQGGSSDDILLGTSGNDVIRGGAGADTLKGNAGEDVVCGEEGDDTLLGANGNDTLIGGQGSDVLKGEAGDDTLDGGSEDDMLIGGMGTDLLDGGSGNDKLIGNEDADVLLGEAGNDILNGGDGNDTLDGEVGFDDLTGGPGTDACLNGEQFTTCE